MWLEVFRSSKVGHDPDDEQVEVSSIGHVRLFNFAVFGRALEH